MTLTDFVNRWHDADRMVILCDDKYYDRMTDMLDDGESGFLDMKPYMECGFQPDLSEFKTCYYLHPKFAEAEVEHFYISGTYVIVWLDLGNKCEEGSYHFDTERGEWVKEEVTTDE